MLRLLVSLLALLLALPASAAPACHVATVAVSAPMQHHQHPPSAPATQAAHDCLGCVPPLDLAAGVVASPWQPTERQRPPMRASMTAGALLVPLSPPPRAA
ncbi:hypothetical protein K7957_00695 [Sphingomonas yunnanensis]|uniref:hypothetical protein n=1 Tax=Sphingomonas yunnanensis TaxID=310400 RepID=UPI001CA74AA4|nr:hypothetical protein [Sphingomonas yunnanensis]MBY9061449.1 hypothetical protein [Sphingomonas yunnanensis]